VATALQIGHIVQSDISIEGLFRSGVLFAVMRATWDQLTFYQNRFDTKDMLHYTFYLLQAMCAFVMAEHLTVNEETEKWDRDRNLTPFAVALAIARISSAAMYLQVMSLSTAFRRHFLSVSFSQILSSCLYLLPAIIPVYTDKYVWFWLSALMCERTFVMLYIYLICPNEKDSFRAPWHMNHLINREVQ
jgi:low temperature requirement protein LtrA